MNAAAGRDRGGRVAWAINRASLKTSQQGAEATQNELPRRVAAIRICSVTTRISPAGRGGRRSTRQFGAGDRVVSRYLSAQVSAPFGIAGNAPKGCCFGGENDPGLGNSVKWAGGIATEATTRFVYSRLQNVAAGALGPPATSRPTIASQRRYCT